MKRKRLKTPVFYYVLAGLLTAVLAFSGYQALKIYLPQSKESNDFAAFKAEAGIEDISAQDIIDAVQASKSANASASQPTPEGSAQEPSAEAGQSAAAVQTEPLRRLSGFNSDFVGWLSIEDTAIDYPVMKSSESDPEFYLHRDFDKNYSYSGTLFIGEGCNADSDAFVIYGHNMNAGTMFGSLDNYKNGAFALEHRDIVFRTPKENRVYRVFAAFQTKLLPEDSDGFAYYRSVGKLSRGEYEQALESIRGMSLISLNDAPAYPQQMVFLSTCYYHTDEGRFVVAAYRVA